MERPVWAEVDLTAIAENLQAIRAWVSDTAQIMAVVKANAYGHGVIPVAQTCLANGADSLSVAVLTEGVQLRKHGFAVPILVMGYTSPEQYHQIPEYNLTQAVFSLEQGELLSKVAVKAGRRVKVHLKVDTGMGRIGFVESQLAEMKTISELPGLIIEGVFTHFAAADEPDPDYTLKQLKQFMHFIDELSSVGIKPKYIHAANSAGIIQYPNSHFNLVRPGLILYGMYPSRHVKNDRVKLKPAMTFKARIAFIKQVKKGTTISYGCTYTAPKDSVIATLPLGYADGYSRLLSNCGQVLANGQLAPVVGRVCMDQTMIDITHIPQMRVGDEVILFGVDNAGKNLSIEDVASWAGTINYELVCKVSYRVPRKYIESTFN